MTNIDTLIKGFNEIDINVNDRKIDKFKSYKTLLKSWNKKINITAIDDDREIDIKHFLDSLTVFKTNKIEDNIRIIDIGTGGGFPGIPMKIINDTLDITLLDSLKKRLTFLDEVIETLQLDNIRTIHGRAEDYGKDKDYRENFDIAVSRAVASLNILCEYCLPFVKVGGYFIAMKGPALEDEIEASKKAITTLGGKLEDKIDVNLPFSDIVHKLLIIKKIEKTPTKYPRKPGKPKKNPL
ncbi:16S rRNA (guanine(527)-N(7))-methyltransferase RsmG [Dethiothermospora halolimnae]|uniref:16S rRNA (guanine(527)-N(7))-methyltransferase RsmG n=1 Tax=Dethiothermospora halolimnae TaxID=3114390 RepID=UPI003CCBEAF7